MKYTTKLGNTYTFKIVKPIKNHTNYVISKNGNVFSLKRKKYLKKEKTSNGYFRVPLSKKGKEKKYFTHRLVALHFISCYKDKKFVNHKDGNKSNNHVSNLEWCTHKENIRHAWDSGLCNGRETISISKSIQGTNIITGEIITFSSMNEAGRNGFYASAISNCCNGKKYHNTHKGYVWKFI